MIEFEYFKPSPYSKILKATVHISGKLGFTLEAIRLLELDKKRYIKIARNSKDKTDTNLYIFVYNDEDENTFKVIKAGKYVYVNTKTLFDSINLNYKEKKMIYRITEEFNEDGAKYYKLIQEERDRITKKTK